MNKIEGYRLSHPELLSEGTLSEILENSCIVLPVLGTVSKEELIEIYKRIALPMPQRKYNESRDLGKRLNNLRVNRSVKIAEYSKNTELSSSILGDEKKDTFSSCDKAVKNRLKPPLSDNERIIKKIRLSNSCHPETASDVKRKIEISSLPDTRKRQKITWP